MSVVVAIDGPAAAGKGTLGRALARHFGLGYLDTGLLYRAVARRVLDGDTPEEAARNLRPEDLADTALRSPEVGQRASEIAAMPEVRAALADFQREFARRPGGAVLDGRDIGTVICPDADVKLFVTASDEVRARRRWRELRERGVDRRLGDVLRELRERDARDAGRDSAPMRQAPDAIVIDTTGLSADEALASAIAAVGPRIAQP